MKKSLRSLLAFGLLAVAGPAGATRLELAFRPVGGWVLPPSLKAEIAIAPVGTPESGRQFQEVSLAVPFLTEVPARTTWQVTVRGAGLWAPSPIVFVGEEAVSRSVDVLAAGTIAGEVRVPSSAKLLPTLLVRLRPAPGAAKVFAEIEENCPLDSKSRFRCTVPAGSFDLRLRAAGFVTQYRWGAQIPRRRTLAVGTLALRPGASVVGWIDAPSRDFQFKDCTIELSPLVMGIQMTPANVERRNSLALRAKANSRGFFELAGMDAGSFTVTVRHPQYAPSRVSPIEVAAGTETELKTMRLEPPAELTVEVSPPLDPYGRVWRLELSRRGTTPDFYEPVKEGPPTAEGRWDAKGLEPGHYALAVTGSYRSRWNQEEFDLAPGSVVDEQGEPIPRARVGVLGRDVFTAKSDDKGKFKLRALEPGDWHLDAEAEVLGKALTSEDFQVHLAHDPVTDIRLVAREQRRFSGIVVGPAGQPVPGVYIYPRIEQEEHPLSVYVPEAYTDVNGQFEMRLPAAAKGVQLTLYPPGFAVKAVRVDVQRNPSVTLAVSPVGGTVVLSFGRELSSAELSWLDLFAEYSLGPLSAWQKWASLFGLKEDRTKLEIPMLEPGHYTACHGVHPLIFRNGRPPVGVPGQCTSGDLEPGGTLMLRVPIPKAEAAKESSGH